jgi:hypothetical protein
MHPVNKHRFSGLQYCSIATSRRDLIINRSPNINGSKKGRFYSGKTGGGTE